MAGSTRRRWKRSVVDGDVNKSWYRAFLSGVAAGGAGATEDELGLGPEVGRAMVPAAKAMTMALRRGDIVTSVDLGE